MQRLILCCILAVTIVSCQKNELETPGTYKSYPELSASLADSLSAADYQALDFSRVARSMYKDVTLLRVAFKEKAMSESFVLVDVHTSGAIKRGRIVNLARDNQPETFNGSLTIKSLSGTILEEAAIVKGYRVNNQMLQREDVVPDPYVELPEVIIVSSYSSTDSGTYLYLMSFLDYGGGGSSGWYSDIDAYDSGGGGGSYTGGSGGTSGGYTTTPEDADGPVPIVDDELLEIDFEDQYSDPAINLDDFLKCFENIPDVGATCKITIHSDVPVDDDPTRIMNWSTGSPGHAWIRLEKTGSGNTVSQHIGFYPKSAWKLTLTDAPVAGKFVDNGGHEFNASYEVTISPDALRSAILRMQQLGNLQYDIDNYNCTDWALQIWKAAVHPSLWFDIPLFNVPGSLVPGTSTPQGLYIKIKELSAAGVAGATVPVIGWGGRSSGSCN